MKYPALPVANTTTETFNTHVIIAPLLDLLVMMLHAQQSQILWNKHTTHNITKDSPTHNIMRNDFMWAGDEPHCSGHNYYAHVIQVTFLVNRSHEYIIISVHINYYNSANHTTRVYYPVCRIIEL